MSLAKDKNEVLILGGGDGLAAREILKYDEVKNITLVDLDAEIIKLCKTNKDILKLNNGSLDNPKMNIVNEDAYKFLEQSNKKYDVIIDVYKRQV